ncbi:MAG: hypothetical protein FD177_1845 [Desulfovibrionaceae bacterium]|nr:MAG: hypothetical protein FD177_1845 [Desulfovibrionaceae bacterium]
MRYAQRSTAVTRAKPQPSMLNSGACDSNHWSKPKSHNFIVVLAEASCRSRSPDICGCSVHRVPAPQDANEPKQEPNALISIAAPLEQWCHMAGIGSDERWARPMRRRCPVIAVKSVKELVARQKRKETGPRMSGSISTGGTDRSAKEDASFREGGSCFGSAYWPWLSPATSATRSIVLVLKKTSAERS